MEMCLISRPQLRLVFESVNIADFGEKRLFQKI